MCSPAPCSRCGKTTWRGCGQHVEQALAGVPTEQRCACATDTPPASAWLPNNGPWHSR